MVRDSTAGWRNRLRGIGADDVQAIAAVLSVWYAFRTIRLGLQTGREQHAIRDADRRERYFNRYIVDVAIVHVPAFRESCTQSLLAFETNVRALTQEEGALLVDTLVERAADDFSRQLYDLRARLSLGDSALGETPLWPKLAVILSKLEEDVVTGIEAVAANAGRPARKRPAPLADFVNAACARLLHEVYAHDVSTHAQAAPAPRRSLRSYLSDAFMAWWDEKRSRKTASVPVAVIGEHRT